MQKLLGIAGRSGVGKTHIIERYLAPLGFQIPTDPMDVLESTCMLWVSVVDTRAGVEAFQRTGGEALYVYAPDRATDDVLSELDVADKEFFDAVIDNRIGMAETLDQQMTMVLRVFDVIPVDQRFENGVLVQAGRFEIDTKAPPMPTQGDLDRVVAEMEAEIANDPLFNPVYSD